MKKPTNISKQFEALMKADALRNAKVKEFRNTLSKSKLSQTQKSEEFFRFILNDDFDSWGDLEAFIYLASRGFDCRRYIDQIEQEWQRAQTDRLKEANAPTKIYHESTNGKKGRVTYHKKPKIIGLADIEKTSSLLLRPFWGFSDSQQLSIEATVLRAYEWLKIGGFEGWFRRLGRELDESTLLGGSNKYASSFYLFNLCRSDYAVNNYIKQLNRILETIEIVSIDDSPCPWIEGIRNQKGQYVTIFSVAIASVIPFANYRLHNDISKPIIGEALDALIQNQHIDGWWSNWHDVKTGSIELTSLALHSVSLFKPTGWQRSTEKAREWLLSQQQIDLGCWGENGAPDIVFLTTLVLDAINLSQGSNTVTFIADRKYTSVCLPEKKYDFSRMKWYKKRKIQHRIVDKKSKGAIGRIDVLIVTTTEIELEQVLRLLNPLSGRVSVLRFSKGYETYYLGRYGYYKAVVVRTGMGSSSPTGSAATTTAAIASWDPRAIVVAGIAFGKDRHIHEAGDVLVSDAVIPYELQRIGDEVVYKSAVPMPGLILLDRFRTSVSDWSFKRPDKTKVKVHFGKILSGEKLIDNLEFKLKLIDGYPTAIGGDMEAAGVYTACVRARKEWILVKGVSDWADGMKHNDYQVMSAAASASFIYFVLSKRGVLDGL